jgi:uncharacterized protein (DUF488 family)
MNDLFTIGHSTHTIERLIELLSLHRIGAVADVRSVPYSRFSPQFNKEQLQRACGGAGIAYVHLGRELGARTGDPACFVDGRVNFSLLAKTALFLRGLDRLRKGMEQFRISLVCSEKDPIACHRMILVCRHVKADVPAIRHILENGALEDTTGAEQRLRQLVHVPESDLFLSEPELIEKAYDLQGGRIAYTQDQEEQEHDAVHDRLYS